MPRLTQKVFDRMSSGLKRFQPILDAAHARDINESDTVVIVTDILQYVLGFDKYSEITSEHAIRGTYCDLAIKLDGRVALLIEVKAIGHNLKENHVKQAVDYAANLGCEWVVLTNGVVWQAHKISFAKPLSHERILDLNLQVLNSKKQTDMELLWLISREGIQKSGLADYFSQKEALSRFTLASLMLSEPVVELLRRELRRVTPGARIECDDIRSVLTNDVLKRDVLEGEKADAARRAVSRSSKVALRKSGGNESGTAVSPQATPTPQ